MSLILASTSASRRAMLAAAGVDFTVVAPNIDEAGVQQALAGRPVAEVAMQLAELKALKVSRSHPGATVIGSDSMVALNRTTHLDKPGTLAGLREQLMVLRGRSHRLISAVVAVRDGQPVWRHGEHATLAMRAFSDGWLDGYVAACGEEVRHSVGGYHLEGLGVQLFERVEGDAFTIRGLPLIPLLAWLRVAGLMPS